MERARCCGRLLDLVRDGDEDGGRVADVGTVDDQESPGRVLVGEGALQLGEGLREPGRKQLKPAQGVLDVRGAGQCVTAGLGCAVQPAWSLGCDVGLSRRLARHRLPRWDRAGRVDPATVEFWASRHGCGSDQGSETRIRSWGRDVLHGALPEFCPWISRSRTGNTIAPGAPAAIGAS